MAVPRNRPLRVAASLALLAGLGACASDSGPGVLDLPPPETQLDYRAAVTGAPTEEIQALMEQSLSIFRQQEEGAPSPAFLRRRAESDIETAQKILRSRGYYSAEIDYDVTIPEGATRREREDEGQALDLGLGVLPEEEPAATATLTIEPGEPS
jgi:translocation and assembly module TamA